MNKHIGITGWKTFREMFPEDYRRACEKHKIELDLSEVFNKNYPRFGLRTSKKRSYKEMIKRFMKWCDENFRNQYHIERYSESRVYVYCVERRDMLILKMLFC